MTPAWPALQPIKIVDVGASPYSPGSEPYARLLAAAPCEVVGFEPWAEALEKLTAENRMGHTYLPYVIGDGTDQVFHECNWPYTSSLLEPDHSLTGLFQNLSDLMQVAGKRPVRTHRLDDIAQTQGARYLKLDVQGAELMVLNGATQRLKDVVVVHTEVEFLPIYKDQPLFGDIDAALRAEGFFMLRYSSVSGRTLKPMVLGGDPNAALSQLLWGDAIYVRDYRAFDTLEPQALAALAIIMHELYHAFDVSLLALASYDWLTGSAFSRPYMNWLKANPPALRTS